MIIDDSRSPEQILRDENAKLRADYDLAKLCLQRAEHLHHEMKLQKDELHLRLCHLIDAICQDARSTGPFKINFSKSLGKCYDAALETVKKYPPPMPEVPVSEKRIEGGQNQHARSGLCWCSKFHDM